VCEVQVKLCLTESCLSLIVVRRTPVDNMMADDEEVAALVVDNSIAGDDASSAVFPPMVGRHKVLIGVASAILIAASAIVVFSGTAPGTVSIEHSSSAAIIQENSENCRKFARKCTMCETPGTTCEHDKIMLCVGCKNAAKEAIAQARLRKQRERNKAILDNLKTDDEKAEDKRREAERDNAVFLAIEESGRCAGRPKGGKWANLGQGLPLSTCKQKCAKKDKCNYIAYNKDTQACTEFSDNQCSKVLNGGKGVFSSWAKEPYSWE